MELGRGRGEDIELLETEQGTAELWTLGPTVYCTRVRGRMTMEHGDVFLRYGERRVREASGPLRVFHDWFEMTAYDTDARKALTDWSVAHRRDYVEVHIGLASKIVAMGINVANIPLGGLIRAHSSPATFERAFNQCLADHAPHLAQR